MTPTRELDQLKLAECRDVKNFSGGQLVKDHKGQRDIHKIQTTEGTWFLKRYWKTYKKDGLATFFRYGRVKSIARVEWENLEQLARLGIPTPRLVSLGEECGWLWEKFSFIITGEAPGQTGLAALKSLPGLEKRSLLKAVAHQVKQLHAAGFSTPDLMAKHLFAHKQGDHFIVHWIDIARLDSKKMNARARARDLAILHLSVPEKLISVRDRIRFLKAYAGTVDRTLLKEISRRADYLLQRRKYVKMYRGE